MSDPEKLGVTLGRKERLGDSRTPGPHQEGAANRPRSRLRGFARGVGWLFQSPGEWLGWGAISSGAGALRRLYRAARPGNGRDERFKQRQDHSFDLAGTAFAYGITVTELERRLGLRRKQTALLAYSLFIVGCGFALAWVYVALRTVSSGGRVVLLLQFLPFCALFFLMSFYQALINFQIRSGQTVTWRDYLATDGGFLPRW